MSLLEEGVEAAHANTADEELLLLSLESPALFVHLVDRYQDAFLRKASSIIHHPEEAEDIVQETFTKIYFNARRYKLQEGATFRSWAYKILINTTFTHYQKLKKKGMAQMEFDPELYEGLADPRSMSEEESMRDYVASLLSRIPSQLARPLRLHLMDEYSQKEIAAMEDTTVSAVKTRIYRAKRELEQLVEDQQSNNRYE